MGNGPTGMLPPQSSGLGGGGGRGRGLLPHPKSGLGGAGLIKSKSGLGGPVVGNPAPKVIGCAVVGTTGHVLGLNVGARLSN